MDDTLDFLAEMNDDEVPFVWQCYIEGCKNFFKEAMQWRNDDYVFTIWVCEDHAKELDALDPQDRNVSLLKQRLKRQPKRDELTIVTKLRAAIFGTNLDEDIPF